MLGEVVIPKLGPKIGYVITRDFDKRQGLRQVQAYYMDRQDFFQSQWLKRGDASDYSQLKTFKIDRLEFYSNYHFDD